MADNDRINEILSTTLNNYVSAKLEDNVFDDFPLFYFMNERGGGRKVYLDGGANIAVPLLYASNTTAKSYSGYDILDTTPQEGAGHALYEWKQYAVSITIDGKSERQNAGEEAIIRLLDAKIKQAELSLQDVFSQGLFGDGTGNDGKDILGLKAIVSTNPTSGVIGGIDRSVYTWWRNYAVSGAKTTDPYDNLKAKMLNCYNTISKGRDHPDIIITDQTTFEGFESVVVANSVTAYIKSDDKLASVGFENFKFKGAVLVFDRDCPPGYMYMLNTKYLKLYVHKACDFITTPFKTPIDQDARVAQILWQGNLCCSNCSRQGVIYGIT